MATVDVIVPCYNYGRFLRECVDSVLSQEGVHVRVLIIDDCSSDDSAVVGRALAAEDARVEFRRHEKNQGHIATYNEGLEWIAGDYALLLSADDVLTPGALARAAGVMDLHPEIGFTYGLANRFSNDCERINPVPVNPAWRMRSGQEFLEWCCKTGENTIPTPTVIVRAALQKALGGYRSELPHTADLELWLRFAAHGDVGILEAVQAFRRMHGQNMCSQYAGRVEDIQALKAAFDILFAQYENRIKDCAHLQEQSRKTLSLLAFWQGHQAFEIGNATVCGAYLQFAEELDPNLPRTFIWRKLALKRFIGVRIWSVLRSLRGERLSR